MRWGRRLGPVRRLIRLLPRHRYRTRADVHLVHRGITDQWDRIQLRHDLTKALRCAGMAGLRNIPKGIQEMAEILLALRLGGAFRRRGLAVLAPIARRSRPSYLVVAK